MYQIVAQVVLLVMYVENKSLVEICVRRILIWWNAIKDIYFAKNIFDAASGASPRRKGVGSGIATTSPCNAGLAPQARSNYMPIPPMPPIPPISGIPPPAGASAFGASQIMASVVNIKAATDAAFCRAVRVTLVGSKIPISIMSP